MPVLNMDTLLRLRRVAETAADPAAAAAADVTETAKVVDAADAAQSVTEGSVDTGTVAAGPSQLDQMKDQMMNILDKIPCK